MGYRRSAAMAAAAAILLGSCASDEAGDDAVAGPRPVVVAPAPAALSDAEVVALAGSAVWRVTTEGCDWLGSGSAFAIDAHHLVTNRHVIANDVSPQLTSPTGEQRSGRVIGALQEADVAVIEVDDELPVTLQWAPTSSLVAGEQVVVIGYPAPALEFTATTGSIVNFQGRDGGREAILTDAPINPGNSGGPGLRRDATVAGVVTQMTLDDPGERAAIIFTAESVSTAVTDIIADPDDVLSDCGRGPDYVPPIPAHFDVPEAPPPPPTTATTVPLPLPTVPVPTVRAPAPSSTALPTAALSTTTSTARSCPTGAARAAVESVTAFPLEQEGTWEVTVVGQLFNESFAAVSIIDLLVHVDVGEDEPVVVRADVLDPDLESASSSPFEARVVVDAPSAPDRAEVELTWTWTDPALAACPAG